MADYWLVTRGSNASVVVANVQPRHVTFAADLGPTTQSNKDLLDALAQASLNAPIQIDNVTIPGKGVVSLHGPGGAVGALDQAVGIPVTVANSINSVTDFLKLISWLFHPRNILRAVEFLVGVLLMVFGLHAAFQARGERREGFTTSESALTRSELGRVAVELGRTARGGGRPRKPRSAPHVTRRRALAQRYTREERVRERERKGEKPAGHAKRTKGSGAGTRKTP